MAKAAAAIAAILLSVAIAFFFLNQGYGKVSPDAYEVAVALYGACRASDEKRLEAVTALINGESKKQIDITAQEKEWLEEIISTAQGGDWKSAAESAKRIMEDQVVN